MGFGFKQPLVGEKRCVTTLITAAEETTLKTVSPENAGNLWQNLTSFLPSSAVMNEALGVDKLSPSEQSYLQALVEAYDNASS